MWKLKNASQESHAVCFWMTLMSPIHSLSRGPHSMNNIGNVNHILKKINPTYFLSIKLNTLLAIKGCWTLASSPGQPPILWLEKSHSAPSFRFLPADYGSSRPIGDRCPPIISLLAGNPLTHGTCGSETPRSEWVWKPLSKVRELTLSCWLKQDCTGHSVLWRHACSEDACWIRSHRQVWQGEYLVHNPMGSGVKQVPQW